MRAQTIALRAGEDRLRLTFLDLEVKVQAKESGETIAVTVDHPLAKDAFLLGSLNNAGPGLILQEVKRSRDGRLSLVLRTSQPLRRRSQVGVTVLILEKLA